MANSNNKTIKLITSYNQTFHGTVEELKAYDFEHYALYRQSGDGVWNRFLIVDKRPQSALDQEAKDKERKRWKQTWVATDTEATYLP